MLGFEPETVNPATEPAGRPPIAGKTIRARHASATGARKAVKTWGPRTSALLQVLGNGGALSRNELAVILKWPITSVCSILGDCLKRGQVESAGEFESVEWEPGIWTRRERFRIKR